VVYFKVLLQYFVGIWKEREERKINESFFTACFIAVVCILFRNQGRTILQ